MGDSFLDKLVESARWSNSLVSFGLDPVVEAFDASFTPSITRFINYMHAILEEMEERSVFPAAFKPNHGFYLAHDNPFEQNYAGSNTLAAVVLMIQDKFPKIPIILDSKRGDIATSSANYAVETMDVWQADATTISPYMGHDSIGPFAQWTEGGKGVYVLCRTSNPGASDFQDLLVQSNMEHIITGTVEPMPVYMHVALKIGDIAGEHPGVGAVVGATSLDELHTIVQYFEGLRRDDGIDLPLLMPGVGGQGGSAAEVMTVLRAVGYPLEMVRINSSSGLTHPWMKPAWEKSGKSIPTDFKDMAAVVINQLEELNKEINYQPS